MGRKSRLKKERRTSITSTAPVSPHSTGTVRQLQLSELNIKYQSTPENLPKKLYRFFEKEEYANEFINGRLRISTLETCRNHKNEAQGDRNEGYLRHHIKRIDSSHPQFEKIAMRGGIYLENCTGVVIENNINITIIDDAYLLCTTTKYTPKDFNEDFGGFCVEITDPLKMVEMITHTLQINNNVTHCRYGKIFYSHRTFQQEEYPEVPIEFIKPDTDIYRSQNEYRFVWYTNKLPITPINIECGSFSQICKRIN